MRSASLGGGALVRSGSLRADWRTGALILMIFDVAQVLAITF
jgi:hypothetical protein